MKLNHIFAAQNLKGAIPMAKKSKDQRVQVIMECTEHKNSGQPGTSRYVTTKNKKNTPERLELKKYNPILKKYTVHKEIK
jgi:large subunit ribosomal protein L33